jgi:hypothetical protein
MARIRFEFCRNCDGRGTLPRGSQKRNQVAVPSRLVPGIRYGHRQGVMLVFIEGKDQAHIRRKEQVLQETIRRLRAAHPAWTEE